MRALRRIRSLELHVVVEQREDVVMDAVLLAEVEVEAVAEDLALCIGEQVLRHEDDKHVFRLPAAREVVVHVGVIRQECLAQQR